MGMDHTDGDVPEQGGQWVFTDNDAFLRDALSEAHIPALMAALVHITGDADIIRGEIKPNYAVLGDMQAGISEPDQEKIRAIAFDALKQYRDRGCTLPAPPSPELVLETVKFLVAQDIPNDYINFLLEELALYGESGSAHEAAPIELTEKAINFRVVIIGAGMSGILAGIKLKQAGIPFTIVDKNDQVAGTWYENTYPGCRVDSPNHSYSYSFEPNHDWPQYFSDQETLNDYFNRCADKYGIRDRIELKTTVHTARYDESSKQWAVDVERDGGQRETLTCDALISAVGQLNRPKLPDIQGVGTFSGPAFHTAEWDHTVDLTGKRVGIIGTGASIFQALPVVAEQAAEVRVFQRTPPWMSPTPNYHDYVPESFKWLLKHVPYFAKWFRFWMFWMTSEGALSAVRVDPAWNGKDGTISAENEFLRTMIADHMTSILEGHDDLLEKTIPKYPVGGKRGLRDAGNYLNALKNEHVHLITDPIDEITPAGISTQGGNAYDFDVLVYGTGFQANKFLWPMEIYGANGAKLHEDWREDPRAYLGITVPDFPNFFCLYGPNTNIVVNGSIIFFSECEMRYIMGCLKLLVESDVKAMDVKKPVHDAFNKKIDAENELMAWGVEGVSSWYKNDKGRVTQNWPGTLLEYWTLTKEPNPSDYELIR